MKEVEKKADREGVLEPTGRGTKVAVKDRLPSKFELRREIHGAVYDLGGGQFYIIEHWGGSKVTGCALAVGMEADGLDAVSLVEHLDGERDPVRAKALIKAKMANAGDTMRNMALPKQLRQLAMAVMNLPDLTEGLHDQLKHDGEAWVMPLEREISDFKVCMTWLLWLEPDERSAVWMMGVRGLGRRRAARIDRQIRSGMTLQRHFDKGVDNILFRLLAGSRG